ncbi:inhibitor of growth protein 3-like isoform X2 [Oppia nitens]|uniref:inhibitor of growth protein 3-like isoform X2 n=1 Tax=Oppia nitens TaxID=1686743 RepID=UPI0023DC1D57|nr:inhibitor of growth protein 3-like isoform X2 [Oppia nitens]
MLYLEDYLEMIEHLPQELRDRFTEMREMDLQVHNAMDNLEDQTKQFFSNAKHMKVEQRDIEYDRIKQDYYKSLEDAEEKVKLANEIYSMVDKYLKRLDQELQKFKIELEADNSGITEILERRSLELDNPPPVTVNHVREKRKYTHHNSNNVGSNAYSTPFTDKHHMSSSEKVLSTIAQEIYKGTVATPNTLSGASVVGNNSYVNGGTNSAINSQFLANPSFSEKGNPSNRSLPHGSINYGNTAIAAAASQAIAATQQMQQGRRTASLKASYEAVNSGQMFNSFNSMRDNSSPNDSFGGSDLLNPNSTYKYDSLTNKSNRPNKRSRTSQYATDISINTNLFETDSEPVMDSNNGAPDWPYDPNEPRYCVCNQVSYGDMVACDNEDCEKEWFHYGCVDITQPPKGKWYCPECTDKLKLKKNRKERRDN